MCGIAGLWERTAEPQLDFVIQGMTDSLRHRGPDDSGIWLDREFGLALGQRRLSIIDLSREGHQPMLSPSGRYVIVFNGEVYNFRELRRGLEQRSCTFRGHSDTEVILALIEEQGLAAAVQQFVGMFALAIWDRQRHVLSLVRDRVGIKPLYYGWTRSGFAFGSELKAFHELPSFEKRINEAVIPAFVQYHYVPSPLSIFRDVYKLPPGCILTVAADWVHTRADFTPEPEEPAAHRPVRYWSANEVALRGQAQPFAGTDWEAVAEADRIVGDAVAMRMVADVDLGAFLSGGIDSSTVVALMQMQSARPVKTFTIGFNEFGFNEAAVARQVAEHLGTDHHELYVSAQEARDVIPLLPDFYDEPFSDSLQIPTYLVSRLARQHVTVSLSGDGGDELFGGYNRHVGLAALGHWPDRLPGAVRNGIGRSLQSWSAPKDPGERAGGSPPTAMALRAARANRAIQKLGVVLTGTSHRQLYPELVADWKDPSAICHAANQDSLAITRPAVGADQLHRPLAIMLCDLVSYLPEDILTKVDRASMAVGLEARVPLLDHRVIEFAWTLPLHLKIRKRQGKWLLRQLVGRYVPRAHFERPKQGFSIPVADWLRGPLRPWAEELLDQRRLAADGLFKPDVIQRFWQAHLSGRENHEHRLWSILMFQAWRARWLG